MLLKNKSLRVRAGPQARARISSRFVQSPVGELCYFIFKEFDVSLI
jgi:hypothetical protein